MATGIRGPASRSNGITCTMRTDLSAPPIEQASDLAVNASRFRAVGTLRNEPAIG